MEFSPLYTRTLSGSSSRNSFNEDALEQLEFNINDISRASSPASVISIGARSEGHASAFRDRRYRNSGRVDEEYRRKYSRLKSELELERIKARQMQQEKEDEMQKWKDAFENDRKLEMISMQKYLEEEKKREIARLKEELIRQKELELQQLLMYKESGKKQQHQEHQREPRVAAETREKDRKTPGRKEEEHERNEKDEESEVEKDGDNDVVVVSEKTRVRDGSGHWGDRRKHRSTYGRRSLDFDSVDGGSVQENRRSTRHLRSSKSQDMYEVDKGGSGLQHKRRNWGSNRLVGKLEMATSADDDSLGGNMESKNVSTTTDDVATLLLDAVDNTIGTSQLVNQKNIKNKYFGDSSVKTMTDGQTQTETENIGEKVQNREKERQLLMKDLEEKILALEADRSSLTKQRDEVQKILNQKHKEHKMREIEFIDLKAGYDRELRTVINEHRKVVLANLEKLKLAETVLREATLTEEEIEILSQRHHPQRRLSSSSLPSLEFKTKKEEREREKILQKKLSELTTQIQRLERRIALLKTENEALKKKQDDQKPLEEKIRSLKKRNAELATIARRLEDKAKTLQHENVRVRTKTPTSLSQDEASSDVEHLKRAFARQRAKDLSEHAKNMLSKEKEIEDLRRKCQELADLLSNGEIMAPQFEEKEELVNIIKQAAKERLQLEQQLAHSRAKETSSGDESSTSEKREQLSANEKYRHELEAANEILHKEIEKLEQALHKAGSLEQQLTEKTSLCTSLSKDLAQTKHQKQQLEQRLSTLVSENQELSSEVKDLQEQFRSFGEITEECNTLKISLATAQKEREAAEEEVKLLNIRVHSLENVVRDLQESAEHASHLDNEHKTALQQLQQKQEELVQLQQINSNAEGKYTQTITTLNKQVLELEEKRKAEEERREELAREVQRLQKKAQEQQKVLEEADHIRQDNNVRQDPLEVLDFVPAPVVVKENQAVLSPKIKTRGEEEGEEDHKEVTSVGMDRRSLNQNDRPAGESLLSSWAQKGPIQVYIAKYNYDPFEFSPNENPEAELPLTAGDYVLIVGEMDEDGFFDGELIDGRQGLVPSNFIEKVEDEDLLEFHAALLQAGHGNYSNTNNNSTAPIVPPAAATSAPVATAVSTAVTTANVNNNNNNLGFQGGESKQPKVGVQNIPGDSQEESFSDLEDIAEMDEDNVSVTSRVLGNSASANSLPPYPRSLSLDKQLTNSLLVSWRDPDPMPGLEVQSYHLLVDGQFKTSVKANERTKALLEGVNSSGVHRICVRCLSNRGQSKDAQCTMIVGKDVYPKPSELQVSHLSPTSAILSWLPGNSNYQHSIIINGKEVRIVKPGVFRHTLSGLVPGTLHKVTLIAKSVSGVLNEEKSRKWVENASESIEFYTPEIGAPEPPLNVQVESGPREGTLLLTWLPVTISSSGVCNGAVVAGYHVMADGRKISLVAGPTSDHVVLSCEDFKGLIPSHLSVRTVTVSGQESGDSEQVLLLHSLIKEMTESGVNTFAKTPASKSLKTSSSEEQKSHDTDEEIEEAFREAQSLHQEVNAVSEPYSDSSCSELSDIPEVEEDLIASQDSHLSEVEKKGSPQPAPRKLVPGATEAGPKEFHAQKPTAHGGKLLTAPNRVVPAIEIIRDSSTERGTSADEEGDEVSIPSTHSTPTNISGKGRISDAGICPGYPGDAQNPSAFRQVDQTRHKEDVSRSGGKEGEGRGDAQRKGPKTHPPIGHPAKSLPHDTRPGRESQSPKHRQSQGPQLDSADGPENRKHAAGFSSSPVSVRDDAGDNDSISGEINPVVDANTVRLFIALFDYDPATMSPNVDSIDEELPFREGQILKVFGDKDADGFFKGESLGRIGYIPCNMVSEVQIDDPEIMEQLLQETAERLGQANAAFSSSAVNDDRSSDAHLTPNSVASVPREGPTMRKMIAMYDYDPQELSPNVDAEMELSFKTGDIVLIYGDMDEDGFYTGEINGQQGLVPSNFLQPAPSSDDDGLESASLVSAGRSRSGESLDAALNALARKDVTTNAPKIGDHLPSSTDTSSSNKQPTNVSFSEVKSEGLRPGTASPADDEKPKKKGGFLNKSKNIFKKFTR